MNTQTISLRHTACRLVGVVLIVSFASACDSLLSLDSAPEISQEDLLMMTGILSDALADRTDGMMTDLYDLNRDLQEDAPAGQGETADTGLAASESGRPWRGGYGDYSVTYDPETGIHTIAYRHEVEIPGRLKKNVSALLKYIFSDSDGEFLEFPDRAHDEIASIGFSGTRSGSTTGIARGGDSQRHSSFERDARWSIAGLQSSSVAVTLEGSQHSSGTLELTENGVVSLQRAFALTIETVDVTLHRQARATNVMEGNVTGFIRYSIDLTTREDGESTTVTRSGTIDLKENGTALLRFDSLRDIFVLDLADGTVMRDGTVLHHGHSTH